MEIPDCSLVVTTFSKHSWPLQRIATRVTSMATFVGEEHPVSSTHAEFMPPLVPPTLYLICRSDYAAAAKLTPHDGAMVASSHGRVASRAPRGEGSFDLSRSDASPEPGA